MEITIVGTGYVGLVSGTCFADTGVDVTCVDIDEQKIENLKKGIIPIYEPGLDEMVKRNVKSGRLKFSTNLEDALQGSEIVFIAVGTPSDEDGSADLKYVIGVATEIGEKMEDYLLVVTKSTVPIGTSHKVKDAVAKALKDRNADIDFGVASNPEFLKEGAAIADFMKPDRIVIGVDNEKAEEKMQKLYKPFVLNGHPVYFMDIPSAEMTKYAANSMLATKISFMNDIANLCELTGADANMVRKGIGSDSRIGDKFIYPGIGYGGSCFPKDVKALVKTAKDSGHDLRILNAVEAVNQDQKSVLFNKVKKYFGGNLKDKKIAMWGLSFKPNTDDMREAPALVLIDKLLEEGCVINAFDPVAIEESKHIIGDKINYAAKQYDALQDADALLIVTEWQQFRSPDFAKIADLMNNKLIFDGRNIYDRVEMKELDFEYYCIGVK